MKKKTKKQTLDKKSKNNMSRLFGGGGRSRQESLDKSFFSKVFVVFLCSRVFLPAAPFSLPDSQGSFFLSKECHQRYQTMYLFQGNNVFFYMPHCPQGIQWFRKVQMLIEEYLFKTMLDFLQGVLFLFKWPFHGVILRFLTERSPLLYKHTHTYTYKSYNNIYQKVRFSTRT